MDPSSTLDITKAINFGGLFNALVALVVVWFLVRFLTGALERLGHRFTDKRLILNQISTMTRFIVYFLGISIAISFSVNLSKEVVLALTGSAAVTIGLALKDITASIIAGLIIIFDRPFQVGDRVTFAGVYGEISTIGLRSVRLITLDDNVVTIPNNKFLTDVVSSGNWGELNMLIQMDFFIGVDQDIAKAKKIVEECLTSNRYICLKKPWNVLVNQVIEGNYYAVRLRLKAYVLDVKYEKEFETDVTERVLEEFKAHNVQAPAVIHRNA